MRPSQAKLTSCGPHCGNGCPHFFLRDFALIPGTGVRPDFSLIFLGKMKEKSGHRVRGKIRAAICQHFQIRAKSGQPSCPIFRQEVEIRAVFQLV